MIFSCQTRSVLRWISGMSACERLLRVALEIDVHRIAQAQQPAVDVDLHALGLAGLGIELGVGKAAADDQQRVAVAASGPSWACCPAGRCGRCRMGLLRHDGFAQPAFGDARAEQIGDFQHFVLGVERALADEHRDFLCRR